MGRKESRDKYYRSDKGQQWHKQYVKTENGRAVRWKTRLKRFGITPEIYTTMLENQNGVCAICKKPETPSTRRLSIDHDHKCCPTPRASCGKCVRGLLCSRCNNSIWLFESEYKDTALDYLERNLV